MAGAARYGALRHLRGGQNLRRVSAAEYTPVAPIAQVARSCISSSEVIPGTPRRMTCAHSWLSYRLPTRQTQSFDFRPGVGYTMHRVQDSGTPWSGQARWATRSWAVLFPFLPGVCHNA
jgi:hypothetical protein